MEPVASYNKGEGFRLRPQIECELALAGSSPVSPRSNLREKLAGNRTLRKRLEKCKHYLSVEQPVTVANGVVYASSMAKLADQDQMFALDAATGAILWQFDALSSVNSGPAVVDGSVYWGSGYSRSGVEGSGNHRLYAFSIDGKRKDDIDDR